MLFCCHNAVEVCRTYIEDGQLTMPFYANIEPKPGNPTPTLVWKINTNDELKLDRYEGSPEKYGKTDIIVAVNGKRISAMAYIMTDAYKKSETL